MKHPSSELWMSFLYDDGLSAAQKIECQSHLAACAECRAQVESWSEARAALDHWKIPSASKRASAWKWAAAAGFLFAAGIGLGRLGSPALDVATLNSAIDSRVQELVKREVKAARESERKELLALLRGIEQERAIEYAALRTDLETVAVQAEDKIQSTQQELGQLATLAQNNFGSK